MLLNSLCLQAARCVYSCLCKCKFPTNLCVPNKPWVMHNVLMCLLTLFNCETFVECQGHLINFFYLFKTNIDSFFLMSLKMPFHRVANTSKTLDLSGLPCLSNNNLGTKITEATLKKKISIWVLKKDIRISKV